MALGEGSLGEYAIGEGQPVEPSPIPARLAEQLRQMRREMPPAFARRWGAVIDAAIRKIGRPAEGHLAIGYIRQQIAKGRELNLALVREAAKEMLVDERTVKRWLGYEGMRWR